jgi:beta-glucuronidase
LVQNTYHRARVSLAGAWSYIVDPYETGFRNQRNWEPFPQEGAPKDRAFFLDRRREGAADRVEYDFDSSPTLQVPGDWNHQVEAIRYYEGVVWYRRCFDHALPSGRRLFLRFEAVNYEAHVYLNGSLLGRHEGGFDPFEFEITDAVRAEGNSLVVRVNNRRERHTVPAMTTDWWNYGGITREVYLFETPGGFVRDYHLQLEGGEADVVSGFVEVDPAHEGVEVEVAVPEACIRVLATTDREGRAAVSWRAHGLRRWTPESPVLYDVVVRAGGDEVRDRIGFRTIETRGADILLNGEPVFLRGISIHEEIASVPRRAHSLADAAALLGHARELRCNFVRLAHYPHNEHMARLADELGLLVWEEIPVYWGIDYANPAVYAVAESQLEALVRRDRNRASVIVWSIANETPPDAVRTEFLRRLKAVVRRLDRRRLVSAALDRTESGEDGGYSLDDPFAGESDLVSCNQYLGWYYGTPADCGRKRWRLDPEKPFFASEFGAGARAGRHGPREEVWTEEHQAWLYEEQLAMLERLPTFRGCSPWVLMDFRTPRRNLSGVQDHWNRKGLLAPDGSKKLAWHVLRAFYERIAQREAARTAQREETSA